MVYTKSRTLRNNIGTESSFHIGPRLFKSFGITVIGKP